MAKHVLVIDDSETVLGLVGEALRARGLEATCTSDIVSATRHVYRHRVDLILLDIQMPMVSGNEVCRILKSKDETRHIPVLFHSSLDVLELERLAGEAGADGFISKDSSLEDIVAEVVRRLR